MVALERNEGWRVAAVRGGGDGRGGGGGRRGEMMGFEIGVDGIRDCG